MKVNFKNMLQPVNIIKLGIVVVLIVIIYNFYKNTYDQQIAALRKEKDHYFRTSINSPIENREQFEGLTYFKADPKYKVSASVKLLSGDYSKEIMSSDGRKLKFQKFAVATFLLDNRNYSLILLKNTTGAPKDKMLFLPFTDKTNGEQTYISGRYMDVEYTGNNKVILDFNQAYHPYCLYNYKYSCPIPPSENYLDIPVCAGERLAPGPVH
jgi:uncharacterized protein (DUF1684 family)